jgi:hypothetical protein
MLTEPVLLEFTGTTLLPGLPVPTGLPPSLLLPLLLGLEDVGNATPLEVSGGVVVVTVLLPLAVVAVFLPPFLPGFTVFPVCAIADELRTNTANILARINLVFIYSFFVNLAFATTVPNFLKY